MIDFKKLKPVSLGESEKEVLSHQENKVKQPVSVDGEIEFWKIPINDRALIYIPNRTREVDLENGEKMKELDIERAYIFGVSLAGSFVQIRDTTGLVFPEKGVSGNDPLREVVQDNWKIRNAKLNAQATKLGLDPKSDAMADFRRGLMDEFSVKPSAEYIYFPIIHLVTSKLKDGTSSTKLKDVLKDKDGKPVMKVYLFRMSKNFYQSKFTEMLNTLQDGDTLGGHFYQFSYVVSGKTTEELKNPARDSGHAFNPTMLNINLTEDELKPFDDLVAKYTNEYLRENVYQLMILPDDVHEEIAKQAKAVIEPELQMIALMNTTEVPERTEEKSSENAVEGLMKNLGTSTDVNF